MLIKNLRLLEKRVTDHIIQSFFEGNEGHFMLQPWMKRCQIAPCNWPDKPEAQNKLINKFINFKRKQPNRIVSKDGMLSVETPPKNKKKGVGSQQHTPKTTTVPKTKKQPNTSTQKSKVKNVTFSPNLSKKRKAQPAFSPSPIRGQKIAREDSSSETDNPIYNFLMGSKKSNTMK